MKKVLIMVALSALVFGGDKLYKATNGKCKAGHEKIVIKSMEFGEDCGHATTTKGKDILYGGNSDFSCGVNEHDFNWLKYSQAKRQPICAKNKSIYNQ